MGTCSLNWICFPEGLEASFWICYNIFSSKVLLISLFLNLSTCDFVLSSFKPSICSSSSWLRFLEWRFSSCFSIFFPSKSSLECSAFRLFFNFLIFVTNVLLWFLSRNTYSVLLVSVSLFFVIFNMCAFLMLSFCWSSFICYWSRHILDSWLSNLFCTCAISSSLSFSSAFKSASFILSYSRQLPS